MTRHADTLLVSLLLIAAPAWATDNYQDWWWNPAQDGMGFNVAHQGSTVALAWYHYDSATNPTYLLLAGTLTNGTLSGELVRANGPLPGSGYDPAGVVRTTVGTASISFTSDRAASFTYSYDGLSGTIALERFTFAEESLDGSWTFASTGTNSGCMVSTSDGAFSSGGTATLTRAGSSLTMALAFTSGGSCTHQITLAKTGSSYRGDGTFSCSSGIGGTVEVGRLRAIEDFLVARYTAQASSGETCLETTQLGATK